ncbi:biliverdin-producing heme oxygenase [Sphingomonas sp. VNH70]|uniref:biliverdin-producing heme oxygenase n=1 Tax=Sphingomonas silueang TaxID=3156617 RepID=UPI0032B424A7
MTASTALRAATAAAHEAVDAAYGRFDLTDAASYTAFLVAHARVLPPVEAALAGSGVVPTFRPRAQALAADLAALGSSTPDPLAVTIERDPAAAWGTFYVVEGSRLGGVMLARQVGGGLPTAYLSAGHGSGDWRRVRASIDAADTGGDWTARAVRAAERCFAWYAQAAAVPPDRHFAQ